MTFDPMPKSQGRTLTKHEQHERHLAHLRHLARNRVGNDRFIERTVGGVEPQGRARKPPIDARNAPPPRPRLDPPPKPPVDARNAPSLGPRLNQDQFRSMPYKPRRPIDMPQFHSKPPIKMPQAEGEMHQSRKGPVDFSSIMMLRAKEMSDRGMEPEQPHGASKYKGAMSRRAAARLPQEERTPQQYRNKLPPAIAELAARYGRM